MIEREPAVVEKRRADHAGTHQRSLTINRLSHKHPRPTDPKTPAAAPGPNRTSRPLTILRFVTLACAGVMAWAPGYLPDAAILVGTVLARP
jgi:hypothetical protein